MQTPRRIPDMRRLRRRFAARGRRQDYRKGASLIVETSPPWVVVLAKPSCEEVAERNLRLAGYRVYLPRYRKLMRPHGSDRRGQPSMRPLFVGYLFVSDWRGWPDVPINGVSGLMRSAGRVVEMVDADVRAIRNHEDAGQFDEAPTPRSSAKRTDLTIGESVEFDAMGSRILAVLDDLTDGGKAIVSGLMFGRTVRWTVDAHELRAIGG